MTVALRGLPRDHGDPWSVRAGRLLREIRGFWGGALATGVIAIALESMDRLVLTALVPLEAVGAYHVAGRISLFMRKILFIPQQVASPELAFKWERGQAEAITRDLVLFSKLEWVLGVLIAVPVVFGAHVGILIASDARYLAAEPVLIALAGALPILCLQAPLTTFLRASGAIWVSVGGETIWLGLYLAAGTLLLPVLGLPGFALGQMIAALGTLLYTLVLLRRLKLPRPATRLVVVHGAVAVLLWAAAALVVRAWPIPSLPEALGAGILFALLLNVVLVRAGYFSAEEERRLLGFLGGGPWLRLGRALLVWPRFGGERAHG